MGEIEAHTEALVRAIRESEEYHHFCEVRDRVKEDPQLRREINEFRRHVFEAQNTQGPFDTYSEMERIGRDYEDFRKNPLVDDFLKSELRVCRMIQNITLEIVRAVDLDTQAVTDGMDML